MADESPSLTFPLMTGLDLGYNKTEDRLVLLARLKDGRRRMVLLTRRLLRQLLADYARALKGTSETVAKARAGDQDEVLRMEHIGALAQTQHGETDGQTASDAATPGDGARPDTMQAEELYLATGVRISGNTQALRIGFVGTARAGTSASGASAEEPVCALQADRATAHRLLALLNKQASQAGWGLEREADWLASADQKAAQGGQIAN